MVDVIGVSVLSDYRVRLRFDDGQERDVDLLPFVSGPVVEPLIRDRALFERVRVDPELETIVWPTVPISIRTSFKRLGSLASRYARSRFDSPLPRPA
jgi:hypothetical protein